MSAPWAEGNKAAAEHAQREIKLWELLPQQSDNQSTYASHYQAWAMPPPRKAILIQAPPVAVEAAGATASHQQQQQQQPAAEPSTAVDAGTSSAPTMTAEGAVGVTTQPQMTEPPGSSEAANPSAAAEDDQGAMRAVLSGWRSTVSSMVTSVTGL